MKLQQELFQQGLIVRFLSTEKIAYPPQLQTDRGEKVVLPMKVV
jgi:hypothetical protein